MQNDKAPRELTELESDLLNTNATMMKKLHELVDDKNSFDFERVKAINLTANTILENCKIQLKFEQLKANVNGILKP